MAVWNGRTGFRRFRYTNHSDQCQPGKSVQQTGIKSVAAKVRQPCDSVQTWRYHRQKRGSTGDQ